MELPIHRPWRLAMLLGSLRMRVGVLEAARKSPWGAEGAP